MEQLHDACERQDVLFFFKQWGGKRKKQSGRVFKERTWEELELTKQSRARFASRITQR